MAQERKHPENCATATQDRCECTHCTGWEHGWPGSLDLVKGGTPEEIRNFRNGVDRRWSKECAQQDSKNQKKPKATLPHKGAAVDTVRADLVEVLRDGAENAERTHLSGGGKTPENASESAVSKAFDGSDTPLQPGPPESAGSSTESTDDPEFTPAATDRALADPASEAEQVEALGHLLGQVLKDVEKDLGRLPPETRKAMTHHFWCELIVQLVVVIEEANRLLDAVPGYVAKQITKSRRENGFTKIERKVIIACTKQVWQRLTSALGLTVISDAKVLLPAMRTLAILMCKSPARHPAVVEHCVDPLKSFLFQETKNRLKRVFEDLVPQITAENPPAQPT
ncbi:hypothetical protein [Saccharopolyspora sp. NPDC002376]